SPTPIPPGRPVFGNRRSPLDRSLEGLEYYRYPATDRSILPEVGDRGWISDWILASRRGLWSNRATMNVLILGDGTEELAWASWFSAHSRHHLEAVYPGFAGADFADTHVAGDLEEALATA